MSSSSTFEPLRRATSTFGISANLRLVKRFEGKATNLADTIDAVRLGSNLLKRWQQLAEPSLSACLQKIPGVYTRAEILHGVQEEEEEEEVQEETPAYVIVKGKRRCSIE